MKHRILMIGTGVLLLLSMAGVARPGKIKQSGEKAAKITTTDRTRAIEQKAVPLPPATTDSQRPAGQAQLPAATMSTSATYEIKWQSINGGGGNIQSSNYDIQSSIGQSATGYATSANYEMGAGYWYRVRGKTECSCPTQGDIISDAAIDVFDVIGIIGIAFSEEPDPRDPLCPATRGDVNYDGFTDVFDLTYLIATAFSEGPKPVDPCAP
jgi:hypothetical protein